ncbi:glycerol acyltransferase, partial [Pseudomonas helmanticensis]
MMGEFDAIRPYDDSEVPVVMASLIGEMAFLFILYVFRLPCF